MRPRQNRVVKDMCCLTNLINDLVDEEKSMDTVYLNFNNAFNTVSYSIVLEMLASHGLDKCIFCWVKN